MELTRLTIPPRISASSSVIHEAKGEADQKWDFDYQVKYQRAFEAMPWSIPATARYALRRAFDSVGLKDNDIVAYSRGATPKLEAVTANRPC